MVGQSFKKQDLAVYTSWKLAPPITAKGQDEREVFRFTELTNQGWVELGTTVYNLFCLTICGGNITECLWVYTAQVASK